MLRWGLPGTSRGGSRCRALSPLSRPLLFLSVLGSRKGTPKACFPRTGAERDTCRGRAREERLTSSPRARHADRSSFFPSHSTYWRLLPLREYPLPPARPCRHSCDPLKRTSERPLRNPGRKAPYRTAQRLGSALSKLFGTIGRRPGPFQSRDSAKTPNTEPVSVTSHRHLGDDDIIVR